MNATGSELTLKVARQDCQSLPPNAVPREEGKCEIDVHGDVADGAVSLSRTLDAAVTRELVTGRIDVVKLLSDAQSRFPATYAARRRTNGSASASARFTIASTRARSAAAMSRGRTAI